jgi:hypothetical protein
MRHHVLIHKNTIFYKKQKAQFHHTKKNQKIFQIKYKKLKGKQGNLLNQHNQYRINGNQ